MKLFFVFAIALVLLFVVKSTRLFANSDKSSDVVSCSAKNKCVETSNKKIQDNLMEFQTNPFNILITGIQF